METNLIQQALSPVQAKHELTQLKTGELEQALNDVRVKDGTENDLRMILRRAMLLVGLRAANLPTKEESQVLLNFIYKKFGLLTLSEIQLAFEKAVAGELEIETANCFENFSCEYVGKILSAYKKWAAQKFNENQMYLEKPKNLLTMPADFSELTEIYYQDYLNGKFNIHLMPAGNYDACVKAGYIEQDAHEEFLSKSQNFLESAIKLQMFMALSLKEKDELKEHLTKLENGQEKIKVEQFAKKLAVEYLYKTAQEKGFKNLFVKE